MPFYHSRYVASDILLRNFLDKVYGWLSVKNHVHCLIVYPMEPIRTHATSARKHMKVTKSKVSRDLVLVVHLIGQEGDFPLVFSILFHLRLPHWFPNFHDNPF